MSTQDDKFVELMRAVDAYAYDYGMGEGKLAPSRLIVESLARDLAGPTQEDLRRLVDVVWRFRGLQRDPSVAHQNEYWAAREALSTCFAQQGIQP